MKSIEQAIIQFLKETTKILRKSIRKMDRKYPELFEENDK